MYILTNSCSSYHLADLKAYLQLDKVALFTSRTDKQLDILPSSTDGYCIELECLSKRFSYHSMLRWVLTTRTVDVDDNNIIMLDGNKDILETWDQINIDVIRKNVTQTWGNKSWTINDPKEIEALSQTCGKVDNGIHGGLSYAVKKIFTKCWKSNMLAHHTLALLRPARRKPWKSNRISINGTMTTLARQFKMDSPSFTSSFGRCIQM